MRHDAPRIDFRHIWKLLAATLCVMLAVPAGWTFPGSNIVLVLAAAFSLIALPRLPFPRLLSSAVIAVSGASLYIYLMHAPIHAVMAMMAIESGPAAATIIAITLSALLWRLWSDVLNMARSGSSRDAFRILRDSRAVSLGRRFGRASPNPTTRTSENASR